jgi:hypothetical protein
MPLVGQTVDIKIKRRDDLIPSGVHLKYRITSTYNGASYEGVISDVATTIGGVTVEGIGVTGKLCSAATFISAPTSYLSSGNQATLQANGNTFSAKMLTIPFQGPTVLAIYLNCLTIGISTGALSGATLAMVKALWPELATATNIATVTGSSWQVLDDTGTDVTSSIGSSTGDYGYILLDPHVPTWLSQSISGANPLAKQATISVTLTYTENAISPYPPTGSNAVPKGTVASHQKHARVTLFQVTPASVGGPGSGTYEQVQPSEIIPYGLAGFIYNIEQIAQYEGSMSFQEQEITDQCPIGSLLNITGSANAEWAAMNACLQSIDYDITAGRTALYVGPAKHLGAGDLVNELRANRGPRWYYLV